MKPVPLKEVAVGDGVFFDTEEVGVVFAVSKDALKIHFHNGVLWRCNARKLRSTYQIPIYPALAPLLGKRQGLVLRVYR